MTDRGILKVSRAQARTDDEWKAARATPHRFVSMADKFPFSSTRSWAQSIDICYKCGENRLKESSQHYTGGQQ